MIRRIKSAWREIRRALEEIAVVPNAYRARLMVALRLVDEAKARLASTNENR